MRSVTLLWIFMAVVALPAARADRFNITVLRAQKVNIQFKALLGASWAPGSQAFITSAPTKGVLKTATTHNTVTGAEDGAKSDPQNEFVYTQEGPPFAMASPLTTIDFSVMGGGDGSVTKHTLAINVQNSVPVAKSTMVHIVPPAPKLIKFKVVDADLDNFPATEIVKLVITEPLPAVSGCSLVQRIGQRGGEGMASPIDADHPEVTGKDSKFSALLTCEGPSSEPLLLRYKAQDAVGAWSNEGTITIVSSRPRPPQAYSTSVEVPKSANPRPIQFEMSVNNINNAKWFKFFVMKVPLLGVVYNTNRTDEPSAASEVTIQGDQEVQVYEGPQKRWIMLYLPPDSSIKTDDVQELAYFVKDSYGTTSNVAKVTFARSEPASPKCYARVIDPVFTDRPLNNILLNYTTGGGQAIEKLRLMAEGIGNIGHLYYKKAKVPAGGYFQDGDGQLSYWVEPMYRFKSHDDVFYFSAIAANGHACPQHRMGSVTLRVRMHNSPMASDGTAVRQEQAETNGFTLLSMLGQANQSVTFIDHAIMKKVPKYGQLFALSSSAVWEAGMMYRAPNGSQTYCARYKCADLVAGPPLKVGSIVNNVTLFDVDSNQSPPLFYILYKAPKRAPRTGEAIDTLEYAYVSTFGMEGDVQRVQVNLRKGKYRKIYVTYQPAPLSGNQRKTTRIVVRISNNTNDAVMIEDSRRRHGARPSYTLYQYNEDNFEPVQGPKVRVTTKYGIRGMWLDKKCSAILVPRALARKQTFNIKAAIYKLTATNEIPPGAVPDTVRVIVRRPNTAPYWKAVKPDQNPKSISTNAGEFFRMEFNADDKEKDLLSFVVKPGPKHGFLTQEITSLGFTTMRDVKIGSSINVPKGSMNRTSVVLHYKSRGSVQWTYPMKDEFTIHAEDGSELPSKPLVVSVTINGQKKVTTRGQDLYPILIAVLCTLFVALGVTVFIMRRRQMRARYLTLPTTG